MFIDKVSFDREIKNLKEVLNKLIEEIERKDKIKESITNLNDVRDFLDNYFMNVLDVMEKKVLLRVYNDFNELFKNWFSILIWDEGLKVSLDDATTTIIIDIIDNICFIGIDFINKWSEKTQIAKKRFIHWIGIRFDKFHEWKNRYGKVNEHNSMVPRDFWLEDWEKKA